MFFVPAHRLTLLQQIARLHACNPRRIHVLSKAGLSQRDREAAESQAADEIARNPEARPLVTYDGIPVCLAPLFDSQLLKDRLIF